MFYPKRESRCIPVKSETWSDVVWGKSAWSQAQRTGWREMLAGHRGGPVYLKRQESLRKGHLLLAVNTFLRQLLQVFRKSSENGGGIELH